MKDWSNLPATCTVTFLILPSIDIIYVELLIWSVIVSAVSWIMAPHLFKSNVLGNE